MFVLINSEYVNRDPDQLFMLKFRLLTHLTAENEPDTGIFKCFLTFQFIFITYPCTHMHTPISKQTHFESFI